MLINGRHGSGRYVPNRRSPYRGMDLLSTGSMLSSLGNLGGFSAMGDVRHHRGARYGLPNNRLGLGLPYRH